jgi:hypothetical protein
MKRLLLLMEIIFALHAATSDTGARKQTYCGKNLRRALKRSTSSLMESWALRSRI